jgi:hypothetical protein
MPGKYPSNEETLATALDHVWRWYEFRYSQATQVLNFYMVAIAVLTTGYVTALNYKLYVPAGVVGLIVAGLSIAALMVGKSLRDSALLASQPLAIIQERLAVNLNIAELQLVERHRNQKIPAWRGRAALPSFIFGVAMITGIGAALYAWFGH